MSSLLSLERNGIWINTEVTDLDMPTREQRESVNPKKPVQSLSLSPRLSRHSMPEKDLSGAGQAQKK
jgi:hypothetical protein